MLVEIWGLFMVVDGKIFFGDENGDLNVFKFLKEVELVKKIMFLFLIYSMFMIVNGVMYILDCFMLYVIEICF